MVTTKMFPSKDGMRKDTCLKKYLFFFLVVVFHNWFNFMHLAAPPTEREDEILFSVLIPSALALA